MLIALGTSYYASTACPRSRSDLDDFLERSRVRGGDLVHLYSPGLDESGGERSV